jgi:hypothetical protein
MLISIILYLLGCEIEFEQTNFGARERFGGDLVADLESGRARTLRRGDIEKERGGIGIRLESCAHTRGCVHI